MRSLVLLVGAWLCLGLPTPEDAQAWSTQLWSTTPAAAGTEGAGQDGAADSRLVLQLGMLLALVYVAFVCAWLSTTRRRRAAGQTRHRVRAACTALADSGRVLARSVTRRASAARAGPDTPWTCEIVWKRGPVWSRFQAVIVTSNDRERRVVAESAGLRWPPKDLRKPPTRELEDKLEGLVASIVDTGWEPVASSGSWSERRFVWRRPGEPPAKLRPGRRRSTPRAGVPSKRRSTGSYPLKSARRAAAGRGNGGSSCAS